jgi:hypothetical protein
MVSQKVENLLKTSFRPGSGSGMTAKPESSKSNYFWMPVADPVISGDQVRHDES